MIHHIHVSTIHSVHATCRKWPSLATADTIRVHQSESRWRMGMRVVRTPWAWPSLLRAPSLRQITRRRSGGLQSALSWRTRGVTHALASPPLLKLPAPCQGRVRPRGTTTARRTRREAMRHLVCLGGLVDAEVGGTLGGGAGDNETGRDDSLDARERVLQILGHLALGKVLQVDDVVRDRVA